MNIMTCMIYEYNDMYLPQYLYFENERRIDGGIVTGFMLKLSLDIFIYNQLLKRVFSSLILLYCSLIQVMSKIT